MSQGGGVRPFSRTDDVDDVVVEVRKSLHIQIQQRSLPLQKRAGKEDSDIDEDDGVLSQRKAARRQFQKEDPPEIDNVRTLKKHSLSHKRKDPPAKVKTKKGIGKAPKSQGKKIIGSYKNTRQQKRNLDWTLATFADGTSLEPPKEEDIVNVPKHIMDEMLVRKIGALEEEQKDNWLDECYYPSQYSAAVASAAISAEIYVEIDEKQ